MDDAINEIAIKGTSLDLQESKKRIERLENERKELISRSKKRSQELLGIRSLEYKDIVFNNQTITPIDAAKFINSGYGSFDYILGATSDNTIGLPLTTDNLRVLYRSNQQVSPEEEQLLGKDLPVLESLWGVDDFQRNVENYINYSPKGGRATGHKPAWYSKNE